MPTYGLHSYGTFKYGNYQLVSGGGGGNALGPHVQYRMRMIDPDGRKTPFLVMHHDRISLPGKRERSRIRTNGGDWVRTQNALIQDRTPKMRIRSIQADGKTSDWVLGERGNLTHP